MAVGDLRLYFPRVLDANLVKAHVVKEQRATFSAAPGYGSAAAAGRRPACRNFFWPAISDAHGVARHHGGRGAQSVYLAAEAVARAAGEPARFLLPDMRKQYALGATGRPS